MSENSSKQLLLSILGVAILVVAVVGVSFAAFTFTQAGKVENTITTGTIAMTYTEGATGISITNAMPMTDDTGKKLSATNEQFKFSVSATVLGTTTINYEIAAIKKTDSTIADGDVRLYLEKSTTESSGYTGVFGPKAFTPTASISALGSPKGSMILETGTFTASKTNYYILRMWLAENAPINNVQKKYTVTVNVYGAQETAK